MPNGDANPVDVADDGDEWKVCALFMYFQTVSNKYISGWYFNVQVIDKKNKGTVTRSTDFGSSPVSDIFSGIWRSRLQREGDTSADTLQPFFTLQLNIEVSICFVLAAV